MTSGIISKLGWEVNCDMDSDISTIPLIIKVTNSDIESILKKALYSGASLRWCDYRVEYGQIILNCVDNTVYRLNKSKMLLGLQQGLPYLTNRINGDQLKADSLTGEEADFIIQLAAFNELVYD